MDNPKHSTNILNNSPHSENVQKNLPHSVKIMDNPAHFTNALNNPHLSQNIQNNPPHSANILDSPPYSSNILVRSTEIRQLQFQEELLNIEKAKLDIQKKNQRFMSVCITEHKAFPTSGPNLSMTTAVQFEIFSRFSHNWKEDFLTLIRYKINFHPMPKSKNEKKNRCCILTMH